MFIAMVYQSQANFTFLQVDVYTVVKWKWGQLQSYAVMCNLCVLYVLENT